VGVGVRVPVGVGVDVGVGVAVGVGANVPVGVGEGPGVEVATRATRKVCRQASVDGGISGISGSTASGLVFGTEGAMGCVPNCFIFKAVITDNAAKTMVSKIIPIRTKFFFIAKLR